MHNSFIDFVVLTTPDIPKSKLDRLRKDGATVKVVEKIHEKWIKPGLVRWRDMLSKLHMWKLVEYKKTLFLDADMLIAKHMDGNFHPPHSRPPQKETLPRSRRRRPYPTLLYLRRANILRRPCPQIPHTTRRLLLRRLLPRAAFNRSVQLLSPPCFDGGPV